MAALSDEKMEKTIRHFLRLADCFDEAPRNIVVEEIIRRDCTSNSTLGMWLLYDIMPQINPYIMKEKFWGICLDATLRFIQGYSTTKMIVTNCDELTIRNAFANWVLDVDYLWSYATDQQPRQDFNLLRQSSGGLNSITEDIYPASRIAVTSLVFLAMQTSWSFYLFRTLLEQTGINRERFIRDQIATLNDGWSVETLSSVFEEPPQSILINTYGCAACKTYVYEYDAEIPWLLRLERIKYNIESGTQLSGHETQEQAKRDKALALWKTGLCSECCFRGFEAPSSCSADKSKEAEEYTKHWSHDSIL